MVLAANECAFKALQPTAGKSILPVPGWRIGARPESDVFQPTLWEENPSRKNVAQDSNHSKIMALRLCEAVVKFR